MLLTPREVEPSDPLKLWSDSSVLWQSWTRRHVLRLHPYNKTCLPMQGDLCLTFTLARAHLNTGCSLPRGWEQINDGEGKGRGWKWWDEGNRRWQNEGALYCSHPHIARHGLRVTELWSLAHEYKPKWCLLYFLWSGCYNCFLMRVSALQ